MFQIWSLDNEVTYADLFIYLLKHHSPNNVHNKFGPFSFFHFFLFDFFSFFLPAAPPYLQ